MSFNEIVEIRVQGISFFLDRPFVLGVDWILSKIIACDVLSSINTKKICIDVDSLSFRFVLSILQGTIVLSGSEMDHLTSSPTEFMLFKSTIIHLQSESLLRLIAEYEETSSRSVSFAASLNRIKNFKFNSSTSSSSSSSSSPSSKVVFRDMAVHSDCNAHSWNLTPRVFIEKSSNSNTTRSPSLHRSASSSALLFSGVLECWA